MSNLSVYARVGQVCVISRLSWILQKVQERASSRLVWAFHRDHRYPDKFSYTQLVCISGSISVRLIPRTSVLRFSKTFRFLLVIGPNFFVELSWCNRRSIFVIQRSLMKARSSDSIWLFYWVMAYEINCDTRLDGFPCLLLVLHRFQLFDWLLGLAIHLLTCYVMDSVVRWIIDSCLLLLLVACKNPVFIFWCHLGLIHYFCSFYRCNCLSHQHDLICIGSFSFF